MSKKDIKTKNKDSISEKSLENLKAHKFKKGQSGNPTGRPKGILNYKTRVTLAIEVLATKYLSDYNKKHKKKITLADVDILGDVFQQAINKARLGDMKAITDLFDRLYGKATQILEVSGKDGNPIEYSEKIKEAEEKYKSWQDKWFPKAKVK